MADKRAYSNTRQMVKWAEVQSLEDCTFAVLPTSIWRIMTKLFQERGWWRTTYYVSRETNSYTLPDEVDFKNWVRDGEQLIMACDGQNIIDELAGIRAALYAQNATAAACCAGGSTYVSDGEGGYMYGTEPPLSPPTTFGGVGEFPTEIDYDNHRCLFANTLVSGLVVTSNNLSIVTTASLFAGTAVVASFVASPPVGVVLALMLAEFVSEVFEEIGEEIEAARETIVCGIYNAEGIFAILAFIEEQLSIIIDTLGLTAVETLLIEVYRSMLTSDILNGIYEAFDLPPVSGYLECDVCAPAGIWAFYNYGECSPTGVAGTLVSGDYSGTEAVCASSTYYWSCNPSTPVQMVTLQNVSGVSLKFPTFASNEADLEWWGGVGTWCEFFQSMPFDTTGEWVNGDYMIFKRPGDGAFEIEFTVGVY